MWTPDSRMVPLFRRSDNGFAIELLSVANGLFGGAI